MKKTLAITLLLASTSSIASVDREEPKYLPELVVYGADLNTNFEKQKQYLHESIRISHDEMIESMKETIEIEKSNFELPEFNKKI